MIHRPLPALQGKPVPSTWALDQSCFTLPPPSNHLSPLLFLVYGHLIGRLTWAWSLALEEGVLPDDVTEAGLLGPPSFFGTRDLSRPFSGGEWAGLALGVAGS